MLELLSQFFSNAFMPHRMCFLGDQLLVWTHVASDSLIALSYYLIPVLLFRFAKQRRDISFQWIFLAFGMFILACGTSHLLGAVTVFDPVYRVEGLVKVITAIASVSTFLLLIPTMPRLLALPSPSVLESANKRLAMEIDERRSVEAKVRTLNEELERRVTDRTADLERALVNLQDEMKRRESLEQQLLQAQKMEAVGRLAGGVAHDFNNILTVILGYSELLTEQYGGESLGPSLREIQQAAERASDLTQQLLAFSRRQIVAPKVVDINKAVRHTEKMLRRIVGEDIEVALQLGGDLPPVKIDPAHLDQVLLNLAVNARDAMPDGGRLIIETVRIHVDEQYASSHTGLAPGAHVMMSVTDTGTGMDEATKARIFEPFFTTKEQGKGTGLGLSIVYGIVTQNGGEILVYSEIGHGTAFKILLPATAQAEETAPVGRDTAAGHPVSGTILLVEDDHQVRNLARAMLEDQGYTVVACASPGEAQQILKDNAGKISLLLTDIVMPGMRGTELARLAQGVNPDLKVLFMSGYTEGGVIRQGVIPPGTAFLRKPFTTSDLRRKVHAVLYESGDQPGDTWP